MTISQQRPISIAWLCCLKVRGFGLGRALVASVEAHARAAGSSRVRLCVRLQLPANQAFYAGLGYTVASYGTHPGFSAPTFVNMVKDLTAPPVRAVTVTPPNPSWAGQFRAEAALLRLVFDEELVAIHHVGSTAIPGIYAKPIMNIDPHRARHRTGGQFRAVVRYHAGVHAAR